MLNDDTLLESVSYSSQEAQSSVLSAVDQAAILAMCLDVKNNNPKDGLTTEEMFPYIDRVISNPFKNWTTHSMALLLRSRLESEVSRKVERALQQLQSLVDAHSTVQPDVHHRIQIMHAIAFPSFAALQAELAEGYLALGIPREALAIFERLEQWENTITCHQLLQQVIILF